jgi:2-dehydro-3-deoxyphosphooctonate aldolase (KDO 8-P synthase)
MTVAAVSAGGAVFGAGEMPLIAGPCVIESEESCIRHAARLVEIAGSAGFPLVFKSSFDKANRTSHASFRGPGMEKGLRILERVKRETGAPILTDIHETAQAKPVAEVADMKAAAAKVEAAGNRNILLTERGASFGYNNLVVDFRSLVVMRGLGYPVIFDATHSVQLPGAGGEKSGGQREFVAPLARAAVAVGVDGIFMEVHENPDRAPSDGPNSYPLDQLGALLKGLRRIREASFG